MKFAKIVLVFFASMFIVGFALGQQDAPKEELFMGTHIEAGVLAISNLKHWCKNDYNAAVVVDKETNKISHVGCWKLVDLREVEVDFGNGNVAKYPMDAFIPIPKTKKVKNAIL
jgi:hypothetical protein